MHWQMIEDWEAAMEQYSGIARKQARSKKAEKVSYVNSVMHIINTKDYVHCSITMSHIIAWTYKYMKQKMQIYREESRLWVVLG